MLSDSKLEIMEEIKEWAKAYGNQIEKLDVTVDSHTLRRLSADCPIKIMKVLDTSVDKNLLDLPLYDDTDPDSGYPKAIHKIYTPMDEAIAIENPSLVDQVDFISRTVYLQQSNYQAKLRYDNKILFVPEIKADETEIYVEFVYSWKTLEQIPDSFYDLFIYACRVEVITEMLNAHMFVDSVDSAFRDLSDGSRSQFVITLENQMKNAKEDYLTELNRIQKAFGSYSSYEDI